MDPEVSPTAEQPTQDSAAPSYEDRVAALFGGPELEESAQPKEQAASSDEALEEAQEPADDVFELEYEGEKFALPKRLEKAVMQERDYTQKSQQLSEQRRNVEIKDQQQRIAAMNEQFNKEVAPDLEKQRALEWAIKQPIDINALGLEEAMKRRLLADQWRNELVEVQQSIAAKKQEWGQKQQKEMGDLRAKSLDTIKSRIPGWNDDLAKSVREHALAEGYSQEELNSIIDPRHAVTMWKAQQFDLLKSKATQSVAAVKSVKTTPSNPMPQKVKEALNFRKTVATEKPNSPKFKQALADRIASKFGG